MTHLNFTEHNNGVWSVEADPALAMKDLTEFAMMSPQEQMDYVMEEHKHIHYIKCAIRIVEESSENHAPALIAMELAKLNVSVMLNKILEDAQTWEDEELVEKAVALSECWYAEVDREFTTMPLN